VGVLGVTVTPTFSRHVKTVLNNPEEQHMRNIYDPRAWHYWSPEGTGYITANWFNPVCDPAAERRRIPLAERNVTTPPTDGRPVCGLCQSIANHPAGKQR
jgi:hypothetical protein